MATPRKLPLAVFVQLRWLYDVASITKSRQLRTNSVAINIPIELAARTPKLHLTYSGGPTIETSLMNDGSFKFEKVPPGSYTIDFVLPPSRLSNSNIVVGYTDITDLKVDLRNNPFPEYPGGSFAAVFDMGRNEVTLHGVITQGIAQIRQPAPPSAEERSDCEANEQRQCEGH